MSTDYTRGPHNTPCQPCGLFHGLLCPQVKAVEYHPDGSLKRVEYREPEPVRMVSCLDAEIAERNHRLLDEWVDRVVARR